MTDRVANRIKEINKTMEQYGKDYGTPIIITEGSYPAVFDRLIRDTLSRYSKSVPAIAEYSDCIGDDWYETLILITDEIPLVIFSKHELTKYVQL